MDSREIYARQRAATSFAALALSIRGGRRGSSLCWGLRGRTNSNGRSSSMPLERHIDDLTADDGVKFWMSDGERPVLCRVSSEALRDLANRVHFDGTDEKVFEAYRELIEQVASDAYDAGTSVDAG